MVNIWAHRDGSVGSSQNRRVIVDNVEKQLKWAIKIGEAASISKKNWDEDQEASHHFLAETEHTCTWLEDCDEPLTLKGELGDRERKRA